MLGPHGFQRNPCGVATETLAAQKNCTPRRPLLQMRADEDYGPAGSGAAMPSRKAQEG